MLLEDVLEEYRYHCLAKGFTKKTMINKNQELKQVKAFLKDKRGITELESITFHDLKAYINQKQKAGLQPQSIVSMSKMVSAFFNWCVKEEYLPVNPMNKVERPKVPKKVLSGFTPQEVAKMIDAFSYADFFEARNKAMIAMLADCGLRSMEIRGLSVENVHETSILVNGKGNKQRIVFISPQLKKILIKYERMRNQHFKGKPTPNVYFPSYLGKEISHAGFYNVISEAGERARIEGKRVSPHTFRHFYSVQTLSSGKIDVYSLSRLLGHSNISTTERYLRSMTDTQLIDKAISSSPLMNINL